MILLLSGLTPQQDKVREIYIERIKQTQNIRALVIQINMSILRNRPNNLRIHIQNINIQKATISEIQAEHQKLMNLLKIFKVY